MGWARIVQTDLINDTSPQLGGDLDANGYKICAGEICITTACLNKTYSLSGTGTYVTSLQNGGGLFGSITSAGDTTCMGANKGGLVAGFINNNNPVNYCSFANISAGIGGFAHGIACADGNVTSGTPGTYSCILANGKGAMASGYASACEDATAHLLATGVGTFSFGKVLSKSNYASSSSIGNNSPGSLAFGNVCSYNCNNAAAITTSVAGRGNAVFGDVVSICNSFTQIIAECRGGMSAGRIDSDSTGLSIATNIYSKIRSTGHGSWARGQIEVSGDAYCSLIQASAKGASASGSVCQALYGATSVYGADTFSRILAAGVSSIANGVIFSGSSYACGNPRGYIWASGHGAMAVGNINSQTSCGISNYCRKSLSGIRVHGDGAFAHGYAHSFTGCSRISAAGAGSNSFGEVYAGIGINCTLGCYAESLILSNGAGSLAFGKAESHTASATSPYCGDHYIACSRIRANGIGSLAFGSVNVCADVADNYGFIDALGVGAFAGGSIKASSGNYGKIISVGAGSIAFGYSATIVSSPYICAKGKGSFAMGYSNDASIYAKCNNSFQIGPGNNTSALSLQVGTATAGVRIQGDGKIYTANSQGLASFSGAITNLTVVNGIVTAAS